MSHDDLHEFEPLMRQIEATQGKNDAQPDRAFKQQLRRDLLAQHDTQELSRDAAGRLWRFAGSLAALAALGIVMVFGWLALAAQQTSGEVVAVQPRETATAVVNTDPLAQELKLIGSQINGYETGTTFLRLAPGESFEVTLTWTANFAQPRPITTFVHVVDKTGQLWAQSDQPLTPTTATTQSTEQFTHTLILPATLPNDQYDIVVGFYNGASGKRSLETTISSVVVTNQDSVNAIVSGTDQSGLQVRDTPSLNSQPLLILAEGSHVSLLNTEAVEADGFLWRQVQTLDGETGWVMADFLVPAEETAVSPPTPTPSDRVPQRQNNVWIAYMVQHERRSANDPITVEGAIGYELRSADEALLKLHYAHPDWESSSNGRMPVDGMTDFMPISGTHGLVPFSFTGNPSEMRQIVGSDAPVLLVQMGNLEAQNGTQTLNLYANESFANFTIDLNSTEEHAIVASDPNSAQRAIISNTSEAGAPLRKTPAGQMVVVIDEGEAVIVVNEPAIESEGLMWQRVITLDGQSGWVNGEFLRFVLEGDETAVLPPQPQAQNQVWIRSLVQQQRDSINDPITLEITVGYELNSADQASLHLKYSNPDWQSIRDGSLPLYTMNQGTFVPADKNVYMFIFTGDPAEMQQISGTDKPILLLEMGNTAFDNESPTFDRYAFESFTDFTIDLNSTDQNVTIDNSRWPSSMPNGCATTHPPAIPFTLPDSHASADGFWTEFWYGSEELWTAVPNNGVWYNLPQSQDGYTQKTFWWREGYSTTDEPNPNLTVTGVRLDGAGETFTGDRATNGYYSEYGYFMLVGVTIPTPGCWEITGTYDDRSLSYVIWVAP